MKRSKKINAYIYKLLIEKKMDGLSVIEARDTVQMFENSPDDSDQVRKIIYRQIRLCEKNGWLRSEGQGQAKRYYKTDLFNSLSFEPRKTRAKNEVAKAHGLKRTKNDYPELLVERNKLMGMLDIKLDKIEKYKELNKRYPEQSQLLEDLLTKASRKAAFYMAGIEGITDMLNGISDGMASC